METRLIFLDHRGGYTYRGDGGRKVITLTDGCLRLRDSGRQIHHNIPRSVTSSIANEVTSMSSQKTLDRCCSGDRTQNRHRWVG